MSDPVPSRTLIIDEQFSRNYLQFTEKVLEFKGLASTRLNASMPVLSIYRFYPSLIKNNHYRIEERRSSNGCIQYNGQSV
jgi:hypothetical protein